MSQATKPPQSIGPAGLVVAGVFAVVLFTLVGVFVYQDAHYRPAKPVTTKPAELGPLDRQYGTSMEAEQVAMRFARDATTFPAEATFDLFSPQPPSRSSDGTWCVSNVITAKNAFGVNSRYVVEVMLRKYPDGTWTNAGTSVTESRD